MERLKTLHHAPHLTLTLQEEEDAPALFALVQEEKARLRRTLPWPDSVRQVSDTLHTIQNNRADFFAGRAAVYLMRWHGEIAGVVSFNSLDNREGTIGYWIAQRFEGKGIVSQSVATLVKAFGDAGLLDSFVIKASTENARSNALAQRLGFAFVDRLAAAEKIGDRVYDQNRYRYQR